MARGHIRQRSKKNKDSWTVYVYQGVDPVTGKKKYTTEVVHTGKRDAEKRLTELLRLHDTGQYVEICQGKNSRISGALVQGIRRDSRQPTHTGRLPGESGPVHHPSLGQYPAR